MLAQRPESPGKAHLIGICGTGMGSLALLLKELGWQVQGSDAGAWPPMSDVLAAAGIPILPGFDASRLASRPDLVVVGNIASSTHVEAVEAERLGLLRLSMGETLERLVLAHRHPVVVAGTHGKTTTTAILAWCLDHAGLDPGYLVGGLPVNFPATARLGSGELFVIEGDEYENAYFDRNPKFFRYRPRTAILTSIELDHVEVFADLGAVRAAFRRFVGLLPPDGLLVACADDPEVAPVAAASPAPVRTYGLDPAADMQAVVLETGEAGTRFQVRLDGRVWGEFAAPLHGDHNLRNMAATLAVLESQGVSPAAAAAGLATFAGVRRRQEIRGEAAGVTVVDDFAHHPTAVRETLKALRQRFPGRRLVTVFEPRTNSSRRALFQADYEAALSGADWVVVAAVDHPELAPEGDRFDPLAAVAGLQAGGTRADHIPDLDLLVRTLAAGCLPGDVVAVLSNGSFGGLHGRLLEALQGPGAPAAGNSLRSEL